MVTIIIRVNKQSQSIDRWTNKQMDILKLTNVNEVDKF